MEFITAEQFKEQPIEVQKLFLDWWQPSIGDIFIFITDEYDNSDCNIGVLSSEKQVGITNISKGEYRTPLFVEGQIRRFVEDKTKCKIDIIYNFGDGYDLELCKEHEVQGCFISERMFEYLGTDLLQAYWKVACIIAKEFV